MSDEPLAIRISGLRRERPVTSAPLDSLDLEVRQGVVYGFLGPNGARTTTTMRILSRTKMPGCWARRQFGTARCGRVRMWEWSGPEGEAG